RGHLPDGWRADGAPRRITDFAAAARRRAARHLRRVLRRPGARSRVANDVGQPPAGEGWDDGRIERTGIRHPARLEDDREIPDRVERPAPPGCVRACTAQGRIPATPYLLESLLPLPGTRLGLPARRLDLEAIVAGQSLEFLDEGHLALRMQFPVKRNLGGSEGIAGCYVGLAVYFATHAVPPGVV